MTVKELAIKEKINKLCVDGMQIDARALFDVRLDYKVLRWFRLDDTIYNEPMLIIYTI